MPPTQFFLLSLLCAAAPTWLWLVTGQETASGCQTRCGNLEIKYPFGTSRGCYLDEDFLITCNHTLNKPFLRRGNIEMVNISYHGELQVLLKPSYVCYNQGDRTDSRFYGAGFASFTLSNKNKFIAVGCDTYAYMEAEGYSTGCISRCNSTEAVASAEGPCSGIGCCQISIPSGVSSIKKIAPYSFDNHSFVSRFNPCTYAFLVEDGSFNFSAARDLKDLRSRTTFPVVVDWSVGNKTCKQVNTNVCSVNSVCVDSTNRAGYICECQKGYAGNPYLRDGCKDIDECAQNHTHNCTNKQSCHNTIGGFHCRKKLEWTVILLGTIIGFLVFLLGLLCLNQELRNRKRIQLREKFFVQNGGIMLRRKLSSTTSSGNDIKIFTEEQIKKATDNYDESRILGEGGQGTVYKGIQPDNQEVAIKKARIGDRSQVEQFINEVVVLSQINHRNVVKLLGCCLETELPLLVYEFVSNGTLFDHLHTSKFGSLLPWEDRLRIAVEIAGTLSYLHSSASVPIIHRDVKSANILLDDKFLAKVSDFGASRLIPVDRNK